LGDGFGHVIWRAIFAGNEAVQESGRRNKNSLNNACHLRWRPEEFLVILEGDIYFDRKDYFSYNFPPLLS
jgi:hypothetical protein